ncbi:hypothetical protein ACFV2X_52755 [Streptomyces sp. NPDC059679]
MPAGLEAASFTADLGSGRLDMVSVIEAIEARTDALGQSSGVLAATR